MLTTTEIAAHFNISGDKLRYAITHGWAGWPCADWGMVWYEPAVPNGTPPGTPCLVKDTWICARCVRLSQPCYAARSKQTKALCTDCVVEIELDRLRWCNCCQNVMPATAMLTNKARCKACERVYRAKYAARKAERERIRYAAKREELIARHADYRAANRDRILAQRRVNYRARRDVVRAQRRADYVAHRPARLLSAARWRVQNRDRQRLAARRGHLRRKLEMIRRVASEVTK